ncbi:hypothetical protein B0T14DRAFT_135145 [Immersiella caudata]|uniref:Uncharacterized protein n=1 Tax=Immersiella caudata TaxID=314043 RepID=A0AA39X569_9PEZI|nr:hypothetical protein B0T14DRAFT_135145 [Immersiella caudata]
MPSLSLTYRTTMPGLPSWVPDWTVESTATTPCIELAGSAEMVTANNLSLGWNAAQIHPYEECSRTHYYARLRFRAAREALDAKSAAIAAILNTGFSLPVPKIEILHDEKLLSVSDRYLDRVQSMSCGMSSGLDATQTSSNESLQRRKALVRWLNLARSVGYNNTPGETGTVPASFLRTISGDLAFDWTDVVDTRMPEQTLTDKSPCRTWLTCPCG